MSHWAASLSAPGSSNADSQRLRTRCATTRRACQTPPYRSILKTQFSWWPCCKSTDRLWLYGTTRGCTEGPCVFRTAIKLSGKRRAPHRSRPIRARSPPRASPSGTRRTAPACSSSSGTRRPGWCRRCGRMPNGMSGRWPTRGRLAGSLRMARACGVWLSASTAKRARARPDGTGGTSGGARPLRAAQPGEEVGDLEGLLVVLAEDDAHVLVEGVEDALGLGAAALGQE